MLGAVLNRWLVWIRLFDFDVRHVSDKRYLIADGLSRRPWCPDDDVVSEVEDIEEFLNNQLFCFGVISVRVLILERKILLIIEDLLNEKSNYIDYYKEIAQYLNIFKRLRKLT